MRHLKPSTYTNHGFSLLELLTAVAIIGIMANLAIFAFGAARQGAVEQKNKRNAQEIASVAATASAAGAEFAVLGDERASIDNLVKGCRPATGIFRNREFKVAPMEETDIEGAMDYLALNGPELVYQQYD